MSNILRVSPASPSSTQNRAREKRTRDPILRLKEHRPREKVYAAVQKALIPLKPSANVLKQTTMLVERNNDLRAVHSKSSMALRRWFREGEVVWCALPRPIVASPEEEISIQFWPAVVEEVLLKAKAIPREKGLGPSTSTSSGHGLPSANSSAVQLNSMEEDGRGTVLETNDDPLHYTINQWTRYKVRFLAVSQSCSTDDVNVLPYQAYVPPDKLISFMTRIPPNDLNFERELLAQFNPCVKDHTPSFSDAASPFAMALQISSALSSFWSLTDEYQMKYTLPPSVRPPPPVPSPTPAPQSLQSAIEAAGRHNAQLTTDSMMFNSTYRSLSGTNPAMTQAELLKTSTQILGIPSQSESLSQTRFQGLWWGTERIWVDDFVRLKVPRRSLAPEGAANIFPPAGAGKRRLEECLSENKNPDEFTAGTRGVFMRLEGLFVVDVPRDDDSGTKKAARACGTLYELVDEDWEDPKDKTPEAPSADPASQSQQIAGTVPSTEGQTSLSSSKSGPSGPVQVGLLPVAPVGFKLRPIMPPEYQIVVELGLISGRYYPRILSHPKVVPAVREAFSRSIEEGGVSSANNLWALEGLSGGYHNSIDPARYKRSRVSMMQDADRECLIQLQAYKKTKMEDAMNGGFDEEDPMDIDEMYA